MPLPASNRRSVVPRAFLLYGACLCFSLMFLGVAASFFVSSLNDEYQGITSTNIPSLGLVRAITAAHTEARRDIEALPFGATAEMVDAVERRITDAREANGVRIQKLETLLNSSVSNRLCIELRGVREGYWFKIQSYLQALRGGLDESAYFQWRSALVYPDIQYGIAQEKLAQYCEHNAEVITRGLSVKSQRLVRVFLVIAAWPVIVAVGFLMYGLVSTSVLFFRARG